MSSFKHLFSTIDAIEFNIPENHFVEEDDIPLARLYNLVIENDLTENEVMEWATGSTERSVLFERENEMTRASRTKRVIWKKRAESASIM